MHSGPGDRAVDHAGQRPPIPVLPVPSDPDELEQYIADAEQQVAASHGMKPGNEAGIVWAFPSDRHKTPLSVVYLHGFGASRGEAEEAVRYIAASLGANAFFARLPHHGLANDDVQRGMTAQALIYGAARALAIGASIGQRVILIGTSMGASLSIILAAHQPERVAAVVAWSPGVSAPPAREAQIRAAAATTNQLFPDETPRPEADARVWSTCRHSDGYRSLVDLMDGWMQPATFCRVQAPVFMGYYYRNEAEQDASASVFAMKGMFDALATPYERKLSRGYPDGHHALASRERSDAAIAVAEDTLQFLRAQLGR